MLNASDRCDQCGAQAYVAVIVYGTELLYCGHDWYRNRDKLIPVATGLRDFTFLLEG